MEPLTPPNVFGITDTGRVRDHNEDAYQISSEGCLFVVADGMGGHEAGEVAAALALETIVEYLSPEKLTAAGENGDVGALLLDAVNEADQKVFQANRSRGDGKDMGCTIAVGYIRGRQLATCHVGDVRCYVLSGGVLRQITKDHSLVGTLVQSGQLTPEEARVHPKKNEVLQAVGMPTGVIPDVNRVDVSAGDRILVCSDGLWEALPDREIQSILESDGSVRQLATQLVDRANGAGGTDNITVVLHQVAAVAEEPAADAGGVEGGGQEIGE